MIFEKNTKSDKFEKLMKMDKKERRIFLPFFKYKGQKRKKIERHNFYFKQ